jgi:hypothetical protein
MLFLRSFSVSLSAAALLMTAVHADPSAPTVPTASTTKPAPAAASTPDNEDKTFPAQSAVAAKTAFQTVPASDKSLAAALDAKALVAAAKLAGKLGSFQGTVVQVYSPKSHGFVALDFAAHYKDALTADIAPADYAKFPDLSQLAGKHILVSGKFVAHGDQTQLAVTSPDQIKIVP